MPEPSAFEVEMAIEKLKRHKYQVLIKSQQRTEQFAPRSIKLLILFGTRRNCTRSGRSRSLYLLIRTAIKHSNYRGISLLSTVYKMLSNILLSRLTPYAEEIVRGSSIWISTQQIKYSSYILHSSNTWEKMGIQ